MMPPIWTLKISALLMKIFKAYLWRLKNKNI